MTYGKSKKSYFKNKKNNLQSIKKRYSNKKYSLKNTKYGYRKSHYELYENKSKLFIDFSLIIKKSDVYSGNKINEIKQNIYLISKLPEVISSFLFPEDIYEDDEDKKSENVPEKNKEFGFKNTYL